MRCWRLVGSADEEEYEYNLLYNSDWARRPSPAATRGFVASGGFLVYRQRGWVKYGSGLAG